MPVVIEDTVAEIKEKGRLALGLTDSEVLAALKTAGAVELQLELLKTVAARARSALEDELRVRMGADRPFKFGKVGKFLSRRK